MRVTTTAYAAIRQSTDDGHEWIDMETLSGDLGQTRAKARDCDQVIAQWALNNPVARYATITLTEQDNSPRGRERGQ